MCTSAPGTGSDVTLSVTVPTSTGSPGAADARGASWAIEAIARARRSRVAFVFVRHAGPGSSILAPSAIPPSARAGTVPFPGGGNQRALGCSYIEVPLIVSAAGFDPQG